MWCTTGTGSGLMILRPSKHEIVINIRDRSLNIYSPTASGRRTPFYMSVLNKYKKMAKIDKQCNNNMSIHIRIYIGILSLSLIRRPFKFRRRCFSLFRVWRWAKCEIINTPDPADELNLKHVLTLANSDLDLAVMSPCGPWFEDYGA
jgi:hypothetical protein